jgi:hypothetical protein
MPGLEKDTVSELWAHAREHCERAERELDPGGVRRAAVVLAVAGSAGDEDGFRAEVACLVRAARKVGMDPIPLFDAASAMVDPADDLAREVFVTAPRG